MVVICTKQNKKKRKKVTLFSSLLDSYSLTPQKEKSDSKRQNTLSLHTHFSFSPSLIILTVFFCFAFFPFFFFPVSP